MTAPHVLIHFATTKRGERLAHFALREDCRPILARLQFHSLSFWVSLRIPDNHARRCHAELLARFLMAQGLTLAVGDAPISKPADDSPGFGFCPVTGALLCQEAIKPPPKRVSKR